MLFLVPIPTAILTLWPMMNKENGEYFNLLKRQKSKEICKKMTLGEKKEILLREGRKVKLFIALK